MTIVFVRFTVETSKRERGGDGTEIFILLLSLFTNNQSTSDLPIASNIVSQMYSKNDFLLVQ